MKLCGYGWEYGMCMCLCGLCSITRPVRAHACVHVGVQRRTRSAVPWQQWVWSSLSNCLWPGNWRRTLEAGGGPFTRQSLLDLSSMQLLNTSAKPGCVLARLCTGGVPVAALKHREVQGECEVDRYVWICRPVPTIIAVDSDLCSPAKKKKKKRFAR